MKKNRILTEAQKKEIFETKQKNIIENFSNIFNKIKRINENEVGKELPEEDIIEMLSIAKKNKPNNQTYKSFYGEVLLPELDWDPTKISYDDEYNDYKYEFVAHIEDEEKGIIYSITLDTEIDIHTEGEYRKATLYSPEEYPESEISHITIKNIKVYKELNGQPEKEYTTNNKQLIDLINKDIENIVETLFDSDEL